IVEASTPLGSHLTKEQKEFFAKHGIIHFPGFISRETVAAVWKACEEIQDRWVAENRELINGIPVKYGNDVDGKRIVQRFAFANQNHPILAELLEDPRLKAQLDIVGEVASLGIIET